MTLKKILRLQLRTQLLKVKNSSKFFFYSNIKNSFTELFLYVTGNAGEIEKNKEIGTIDIWGPLFRISFDLIIHSYVRGKGRKGWTSVFSFKGNGGKKHCCKHGDRIPEIALDKNGGLRISNSVSGNAKYSFISKVERNKWYSIIVEQKSKNGKVIKNYPVSVISIT